MKRYDTSEDESDFWRNEWQMLLQQNEENTAKFNAEIAKLKAERDEAYFQSDSASRRAERWLTSYRDMVAAKDAEIAKLKEENAALRTDCARISAECGLPPTMAPADGIVAKVYVENQQLRAARAAARAALKAAVDPVRSWFDGDGEIEPPPTDADIARMAVEELQKDRESVLVLERKIREMQSDLDAARAALKVEREACDEWRQCVCGHESGMGHVVISRALKYASAHDARRAAEERL